MNFTAQQPFTLKGHTLYAVQLLEPDQGHAYETIWVSEERCVHAYTDDWLLLNDDGLPVAVMPPNVFDMLFEPLAMANDRAAENIGQAIKDVMASEKLLGRGDPDLGVDDMRG